MATFTATKAKNNRVGPVHAGLNVVVSKYVTSETPATNDVYEMLLIPNHAKIVDVLGAIQSSVVGGTMRIAIGDEDDDMRFFSDTLVIVAGVKTLGRLKTNLGFVYDISDDVALPYKKMIITATDVSATHTASMSVVMAVKYTIDY